MKKIQITARTRTPEPITQSVLDKAVERGKMRQNTDKALRLAEDMERPLFKYFGGNTATQAAAELRRQHEEIVCLTIQRDEARRTVREAHEAGTRLTAQRDALLVACKTLVALPGTEDWATTLRLAVEQARAAIKAVEGVK